MKRDNLLSHKNKMESDKLDQQSQIQVISELKKQQQYIKSCTQGEIWNLLRELVQIKKEPKGSSITDFLIKLLPNQQNQQTKNNIIENKLSPLIKIINKYEQWIEKQLNEGERSSKNKQIKALQEQIHRLNQEVKSIHLKRQSSQNQNIQLKRKIYQNQKTIPQPQHQLTYPSIPLNNVYNKINDLTPNGAITILNHHNHLQLNVIDQKKRLEILQMERQLYTLKKNQSNHCSIANHQLLQKQLKQLAALLENSKWQFEQKLALKQSQISYLKQESKRNSQKFTKTQNQQLRKKNISINQLQTKIRSLEQQLQKQSQQLFELRNTVLNSQQQIHQRNQTQINQLKRTLISEQKLNQQLKQLKLKDEKTYNQQIQQINRLENEIKKLELERKQFNDKLNDFESQLKAKILATSNQKQSQINMISTRLHKIASQKDQQIQHLIRENKSLHDALRESQRNFNHQKSQMTYHFQQQIKSKSTQISNLKQQIKNTQNQSLLKYQNEQQIIQLMVKQKHIQQQIAVLQKDNNQLTQRFSQKSQQAQKLKQQINRARQQRQLHAKLKLQQQNKKNKINIYKQILSFNIPSPANNLIETKLNSIQAHIQSLFQNYKQCLSEVGIEHHLNESPTQVASSKILNLINNIYIFLQTLIQQNSNMTRQLQTLSNQILLEKQHSQSLKQSLQSKYLQCTNLRNLKEELQISLNNRNTLIQSNRNNKTNFNSQKIQKLFNFNGQILKPNHQKVFFVNQTIESSTQKSIKSTKLNYRKTMDSKNLTLNIKRILTSPDSKSQAVLILYKSKAKKTFAIFCHRVEQNKYETLLINIDKERCFGAFEKTSKNGYKEYNGGINVVFGADEVRVNNSNPSELFLTFDVMGEKYFEIDDGGVFTGEGSQKISMQEVELHEIEFIKSENERQLQN